MTTEIINIDGSRKKVEGKLSLKQMQETVGGYVEFVRVNMHNKKGCFYLIVNEEGLLENLPPNRVASEIAKRPIVGTAILTDER